MKCGTEVRVEAVRYFEMGLADKLVGRLPGIPCGTVEKWLYTYRALGEGGLLVTQHKTYPYDLKAEAARVVVERGMTKPEAMAEGIEPRRRTR